MITRILLGILLAACLALPQTKVNGSRVIEGTVNYCADSGVNDDYACNLSPAISSYVTGSCYTFRANSANAGAASVNLNGLGAKVIKKPTGGIGTDLSDNDIRAGQIVTVCYDGTNMQMQSGLGKAEAAASAPSSVTPVRGWYFPVPTSPGTQSNLGIGTDAVCHRFNAQHDYQSNVVAFNVTTASGIACTGGVCGFMVGIYDSTKALIASTEVAFSGHATVQKDINQTGFKKIGWASGSAVSNGVLSLGAGSYWVCYASDSTATAFALVTGAAFLYDEQNFSANSDAHGFKSGLRTGNGANMVLAPTWTGGLTLSGQGGGERVIRLAFGFE